MSASVATLYPSQLKLGPGAEAPEAEDVFTTDVDNLNAQPPELEAATISEEWRKLQSSKHEDALQKMEKDQPTVVQSQPRGRMSSDLGADVFLQPSQVEAMLGQNSLLLGVPGGGGGAIVDSNSSAGAISEHHEQPMTSARVHRPSIWDELVSCMNPLVGTFKKKDKRPSSKEDEWEIPFADIRELNFIGSGSQGAVFVGEYLREKVAVKKVKDVSYCEEAKHLRKLRHPNIVKFK
jgi:hypothetical protein